ncbi:MAG TPA: histidine triad nucleotide-binding protein [Gemmatimonadota bacterium]|nr:histidine triad nucleotide-binding protein [Gemmatimonadota bacterium]
MSGGCLFCGIVADEIGADMVAEGDEWVAFRDIHPQAPTHVLVVPRRHVATLDDLDAGDGPLVGKLVGAAARIAREEGLVEGGYRLVVNCGAGAGQSVFHVHLHLLGGRGFSWPPG